MSDTKERKLHRLETLIKNIRESHSMMVDIFVDGSCWNFHLILQSIWSDATCFLVPKEGHIVTGLFDKLWDITGDVTDKYDVSEVGLLSDWVGETEWRGELELKRGTRK